jgi:AP-1-like transcription factor
MANSHFDNYTFNNSDLYLNPNETDLLIAALNSNKAGSNEQSDKQKKGTKPQSTTVMKNTQAAMANSSINLEEHPYLDFEVSNASWDWDLNNLVETSEDPLSYPPGIHRKDSSVTDEADDDKPSPLDDDDVNEAGDKRKSSDSPEAEDGGGKRQEIDPKTGKKQTQRPGRKPLTSEPTTVSSVYQISRSLTLIP